MIALGEALTLIEEYYNNLTNCMSTSGRKYNGEKILEVMHDCPEVRQYWSYKSSAYSWACRFVKYDVPLVHQQNCITIRGRVAYDSTTQERNPPSRKGLYLIGSVHANPYTNEIQYWVKVGRADDIANRLGQYDTYSPGIHHIDYLIGAMYYNNEKNKSKVLPVILNVVFTLISATIIFLIINAL